MCELPNSYDAWRLDNGESSDDYLCLRCHEDEAEIGEDYCSYCLDLIERDNREKFQSEETY